MRSRSARTAALTLAPLPLAPVGTPVSSVPRTVDYLAGLGALMGRAIGRGDESGQAAALPQDYADALGWERLGRLAAEARARMPPPARVVVYGENYGHAGALEVYGPRYGLTDAVYRFHESGRLRSPEGFGGVVDCFVYVNGDLGADVAAAFEEVALLGHIDDSLAREYGAGVWLCARPRGDFDERWAAARAGATGWGDRARCAPVSRPPRL